ncbi:hypothetical protein VP1G_01807 [Cytospora mali]|uniref:Uncharacterized protein n=1 Tax=Cytospora mali TaxID=578113 RepID=A0A194URL6_CYTMA|nr:hypothetical protein VP1G_01807 [Valsa mali var. pyri (nom. inval.)]
MALLNPTFIFGVFVVLYLSSFVLFAILRILTGLSIQRIGYFSLRRLAYVPKDGVKVEIRGLGLNVHRPTFSQPTWLSVVISEMIVTLDTLELERSKANAVEVVPEPHGLETSKKEGASLEVPKPPIVRRGTSTVKRSETWKQLTRLKERIKKLHGNVNWLCLVDVVATNSAVNIVDVGNVQFGSVTLSVDTRRKMVDRARFFWLSRSEKVHRKNQAEWIMTVRSVLFTPHRGESLEVLDFATLNIHGFLYEQLDGLREASVALKLGRIHLPLDELRESAKRFQERKLKTAAATPPVEPMGDEYIEKVFQELDQPGSTDDDLVQTVSDSKEFVSSILRGIKEVQFAVSFFGLTKKIDAVKTPGPPVLLNASMKEVGIDLHRLDSKSPAHRMYFPSTDIAHEALLAALSISIGLDDGQGNPQRLLYVPMATTTVRTTLPSKTVQLPSNGSAEQRNANILFANSVVTSPAVDLDPKHLPLLLAMLRPKPKRGNTAPEQRHMMISRLLPKANIKFSMHEPVLRIALPPVNKDADADDFDLIISSISSISLDAESSHSPVEKLHYSLAANLRIQSHNLYYQTSEGERFDLVEAESLDLKVNLSASPDVAVVATGNLQTFAIRLVRPEISDGLRQIVRQLHLKVEPDKRASPKSSKHANFLRGMPPWLLHFQLQASDVSAEIAGVDNDISKESRGVSLSLESWSAEYRAQRLDGLPRRTARRRASSRVSVSLDPDMIKNLPAPPRKKHQNPGDGRRIAFHVRGLEAFIVESADRWEVDPFVSIPRFEVALSTASDHQGPVFHINSHIRTLRVQYSLYRHYAICVAVSVLREAFISTSNDKVDLRPPETPTKQNFNLGSNYLSPPTPDHPFYHEDEPKPAPELVVVDFKAAFVQIKADMPADPPMMLHIYNLEAGRHRWSPPFFYTRLIRLYAEPPRMRKVWSKIVSIKNGRLDYRESRRKMSIGGYEDEKMFDMVTDAIRIAIPHELVVSEISDNVNNVIKAVQQLHHRLKTGTNEYILDKGPEGPKNVPKVSVKCKALLFELEDGAFEWKLGMIYRAGRIEQMQRLAREEAFKVKVKKIHEEARKETGVRAQSAAGRGRSAHSGASWARSPSADGPRPRSNSDGHERERRPRYDPENGCGISGHTLVSISEARTKLNEHNSKSWKARIDRFYSMARNGMKDIRSTFWSMDNVPDDFDDNENILEIPERPALMSALVHDLHFTIDKPSFPMKHLPDFLHRVGKGMPRDMKYALLIPMNVQINMGEVRASLRDYPLPLLHVPSLKPGQSSRTPALSLRTDFVIAEEFRGIESTRRVRVNVIPTPSPESGESKEHGFAIDVRRTIGPIKSFSDMTVDINTALPTRITWGPSYQPAIQDMMIVIESFTKPQLDPSERVGFWDKIRLGFHSRVRIAWKGDGDVHFCLKGSRDPYQVTGNGAGFMMCWRNDVRWDVHTDDDPKRLMTVDSGEFVLAIPDFSHYAREEARRSADNDSVISEDSMKSGAIFKKVVMKLSGKVQWLAGLVFEQAIDNGKRNFDFIPHYDVVLKAPEYAESQDGVPHDAFRGFRSEHIHLSIAVRAPLDRDWTSVDVEPSRSYNAVHLTPRFFTHFYAWWSLFGGAMALPVRQGTLWPGRDKGSKKFGRHLATIKYNLLFAPLFLSHIYKHKDVEDYDENAVSATGIKVRFDSWKLDIHQRREEFNTSDNGLKANSRTTGMKIHAAQLDLAAADIRAVSASIKGTTTEAIKKNNLGSLITQQGDDGTDLSRFTIPDNDFSWIDMDDFVELDWILPSEPNPDTKILPLAYCPRLTYFRQTDIDGVIAGDPDRTSPFGHEPTHLCGMSQDDDPRRVQAQLVQQRLDQLAEQMKNHANKCGEAELRAVRDGDEDPGIRVQLDNLLMHSNVLQDKKEFLENLLEQMTTNSPQDARPGPYVKPNGVSGKSDTSVGMGDQSMSLPTGAEFASDFLNRFVMHNLQLKWNNLLRNIVLRYIHQVSQRRGFVYYLSRPAVKFILDIVEEQTKLKTSKESNDTGKPGSSAAPNANGAPPGVKKDIEERIQKILQDGRKFVNADDSDQADEENVPSVCMENLTSGIADGFTPQNSYHVRLIAPQIQLQSDKNKKNVVMLTSKGMELKVVEVLDKERIFDTVSGLVQRRFLVNMDSTQFFISHQKWFSSQLLSTYSGSVYGTPSGSSWPPWVPVEVMSDFHTDPVGFKRVVQKTSAMLRYDKYNTLRLKYNDEVNSGSATDGEPTDATENRMDNLWVEFPQARAICNSSQYYAMYVIVLDLLMYNEPLEKTRSERLEKIMLASDFSDLRGTPEMVIKLQERIRQLEDIKSHFQIHSKYLDKQGWQDRLLLERDLAACEDELFFMMKAITTSQRRYDTTQSNALLKWSISAKDIVWHLIRDANEPLCELQLKDVEYDRTDNSDGSHINLIRVGRVLGLNLLPDAIYPEMVAPYFQDAKSASLLDSQPMITVYWYMLEAIAGIPIMDHFEVNLFPLKIQLEREVGKKLFEYIFPGLDGDKFLDDDKDELSGIQKQSVPGDEVVEDDDDSLLQEYARPATAISDMERLDPGSFSTRAGSLELRLRPTLSSEATNTSPPTNKALSVHSTESSFKLFGSKNKGLAKKRSWDSLRAMPNPRPGTAGRSATAVSSKAETSSLNSDTKKSRFALRKAENKDDGPSDDLTMMMTRASNYMTFAYIKLPSVVLCLSYKGKGDRNIEDVHDFVFRLPTIEYHNKMWSNLDLALAFKGRVIKALISHTGAIIGNKFRHRPNTAQQTKLRELANSSVLLATPAMSDSQNNSGDDASSIFGSATVDFSRSPPRSIMGSGSSIQKPRSNSRSSSVASSSQSMSDHLQVGNSNVQSSSASIASSQQGHGPVIPSFLMMTSPNPKERTASDSGAQKYSGFGISMLRPSSSNSMRSFNGGTDNQRRGSHRGGMPRRKTILNSGGGNNNTGGFFKDKFSAFASKLNNKDNSNNNNRDRETPAGSTLTPNDDRRRPSSRWSSKSASVADDVDEDAVEEDEDNGSALETQDTYTEERRGSAKSIMDIMKIGVGTIASATVQVLVK